MVLKGFVTKEEYEGLDPVLQGEYKEEGEGFVPNVKEVNGWGFGQIDGLKTTASKERSNAKKYYDQLRQYKGEDGEYIDPGEAKEALENKERYLKAGKDKATVEEQVRERTKAMEANYQKQLKAKDDKIDKLNGTIKRDRVDVRSKTAIVNKKGRVKILHPIIKSKMRVRENDRGDLYEVLLDDDGQEMYSAKDPSKLMQLDEYLDMMANDEETADLFEGSGMKGIGTTPSEKGSQQTGGTTASGKPRYIKSTDVEAIEKYADEIADNEIEIID